MLRMLTPRLILCSLISGAADGNISMWDLEAADEDRQQGGGVIATHTPLASVTKYVVPQAILSSTIVVQLLIAAASGQEQQA